jgi:hypothetical protein
MVSGPCRQVYLDACGCRADLGHLLGQDDRDSDRVGGAHSLSEKGLSKRALARGLSRHFLESLNLIRILRADRRLRRALCQDMNG